jgi:signal transduction histidine kinase
MADQITILFENTGLLEEVLQQTDTLTHFTDQLRTAADIARRLNTLRDPELLLQEVVELLQSRYGLYHAHIYLLDETTRRLNLRIGSGEVGRVLREREHAIPIDKEASLVARAARTRGTVLVEDTQREPDFMPNPLLPHTRAEMSLPLVVGDRLLGVLDLQDQQIGRFTEAERDTFSTLAGQVAVALENAELFAEQRRARAERERFTLQLRTASDIAGEISAILDPDKLLNTVIRLLKERFGLYYAHYYTFDRTDAQLRLRAGYGEAGQQMLDQSHTIPLQTQQSLVARAARTRKAIVVQDVLEETGFLPNPLLPQTRSEVAVPILAAGEVLGVLDVQHDRADYFTEGDLNVYNTLAGQIATAMENATLFEEIQQTAERLREVDRLKSEFLANMSHELRTPLTSINGYAEIMMMGIEGEIPTEIREDVEAIYENGHHLLNLINDVLDLAKIEAGHLNLNLEAIDLLHILDEVQTSTAGLLAKKHLNFLIETENNLPAVQGDRVRLNQVLNNLLSNAIKFTEEGHVKLRTYRDNGHICLAVEDTGVGISRENLELIFERFRQVDGTSTRTQEGTGLGLAITRHLIEMHGGTIDVQSELGRGSTFTVRLPVAKEHQEATLSTGDQTTSTP